MSVMVWKFQMHFLRGRTRRSFPLVCDEQTCRRHLLLASTKYNSGMATSNCYTYASVSHWRASVPPANNEIHPLTIEFGRRKQLKWRLTPVGDVEASQPCGHAALELPISMSEVIDLDAVECKDILSCTATRRFRVLRRGVAEVRHSVRPTLRVDAGCLSYVIEHERFVVFRRQPHQRQILMPQLAFSQGWPTRSVSCIP